MFLRWCRGNMVNLFKEFLRFAGEMYNPLQEKNLSFILADVGDEGLVEISLKSKSPWLCSTCWEILQDFHDFYKRIKDCHEYYDYLVKSETDMDIDEYEVNAFLPDIMGRPPDVPLDEADTSMADNNDKHMDDDILSSNSSEIIVQQEIKVHVAKKTLDVVPPETVIINDTLPENNTLQLDMENEDEQMENPLEFCATIDGDATTEQLRKQFLAKYYRFTCNICQDPCTTFAMLQQHFRDVHDQEAYMICCGNKYTNRNRFGDHIKSHLDPDCFKCKICFKILKNKRNLVHHIARWHEGNIFRCSICNRKFLEKSKYDEHKSKHKNMLSGSDSAGEDIEGGDHDYFTTADKRPTSSCRSEIEYENESNTFMMESPQTTTIDNDTLSTPKKNAVDEHFIECLSYDTENSQDAKEKNKTTTTKSTEKYAACNELTVRGYLSKTSKFKCDICQEPCESFGELRQHFGEDHADQKPYVICCGRKFRTRSFLSEHVKSHIVPDCYKCQFCSKVLKNKRNLRAHIIRWHEEKSFTCDICEKRFAYKSEYEEHKSFNHLSETRIFERDEDDNDTHSSIKKSANKEATCSYTNSSTAEMEQVFEEDVSNESERITLKDAALSEDDNNLHITQDQNNEMSHEVTMHDGETFVEESAKAREVKDTEIQNEKSTSRNKTTPEVLMEFDKFLRQHYKFTCHICDNPDETYENFVNLRQHFSNEHKIEGYVLCCGIKLKRRRSLVDHIKGHWDPNYLKCKYCSRVLRERSSLLHHIALHEGKVKRCTICNKKFSDAIKYENHYFTHIPRKEIVDNDNEDANIAEDSDGSDDDIPLIYRIVQRETTQDISAEAESSKFVSDFSKNTQRQFEHDAFLAKHFKMVCPLCEDPGKTLESFALLREHFASEHKEDDAYLICCAQKYKKRDTLVQHIKTHLNPYDFTCTFCSKVLKSKRNLLYHIAACHEGKQFRCDICQKKFVEESSFKYHKKTHKPNDNPHFPCPECDRSYKIKHKLTHHINTTHRHRYARLCDICGIYFRDSNLYSAHMKSKHQENSVKESYPCDICGRLLAAKSSLRLHKRTQHPENGSFAYSCHICSKPFATKGLLNFHIRMTHKKNKLHKCAVCGKAYNEAKQLRGHMGIHTGDSIYTCNFCPKTFNSTGNRSTHRKKCHPKEWEEWKKKFYVSNTTTNNSIENT